MNKDIKKAAKIWAGSNYVKNHNPKVWQERYNSYIKGAEAERAAASELVKALEECKKTFEWLNAIGGKGLREHDEIKKRILEITEALANYPKVAYDTVGGIAVPVTPKASEGSGEDLAKLPEQPPMKEFIEFLNSRDKFFVDEVRIWHRLLHNEEISFSMFVELFNEKLFKLLTTPAQHPVWVKAKTKVISAFPGTGKTWFVENSNYKCLDSDSSKFDKSKFPWNYIEHIQENIGKYDYIFVSSHQQVRDALIAADIKFVCVHPDISCKNEYLERYKNRGNNEAFIKLLSDNWQEWVGELSCAHNYPVVRLSKGLFISDILPSQSTPSIPISEAVEDTAKIVVKKLGEYVNSLGRRDLGVPMMDEVAVMQMTDMVEKIMKNPKRNIKIPKYD